MRRAAGIVTMTVLLGGCRTLSPAAGPDAASPPPAFQKVHELLTAGRVEDALAACIDLSRTDPNRPGLAELQNRVLDAVLRERERVALARLAHSERAAAVDVNESSAIPDTFRLRRGVRGDRGSLRTPPGPMRTALDRRVTVHLDNAGLNDFILEIGKSENINIIADAVATDRALTIHAEKVPLREILDFISRNLGVTFYVGENLIWATAAPDEAAEAPMDTRIYRLRKGRRATELEEDGASFSVTKAIEAFVPQPEGAAIMFDPRSHVLIARNTRANLERIEDIIEALDVAPPQVLIEARFVAVGVNDLSELGVDWVLDSPLIVSEKRTGATQGVRAQINEGATLDFGGFPNDAIGLNFTYQGLLTEPMFHAVMHALETSGKSRTLSAPRVTTLNNQLAKIRVGEDFRYFEEYDVESIPASVSDGGSTTYQSVLVPVGRPTLEELGIELEVTPSVGADLEDILLTLRPQISEFVRFEYYTTSMDENYNYNDNQNTNNGINTTNGALSMVKVPIFRRNLIETQVRVRSSETVVMGGLISSTESRERKGVPLLSRIPIFGKLFIHESTEEVRQNLLIFVTATLVSNRGESLFPLGEEDAGAEPAPGG